MMKRLILATTLALALALGGCMANGSTSAAAPTASPSAAPTESPAEDTAGGDMMGEAPADEALTGVVEAIYEKQPVELMMAPVTAVDLTNADWLSYNTGLSAEWADKVDAGVLSESMTGSQAYSLVVLRLKDAADAEQAAQTMLDNIDPAKWVCVMADKQLVRTYGDTVVFCMSATSLIDAEQVMAAADAVLGQPDFTNASVVDYGDASVTS